MIQKVEHIGIAVKDAKASVELFTRLFGVAPYKSEEVESEGVQTIFFEVGGVKIELLEPTRNDSPIAQFIQKKGEGIHHIAFAVDDVQAELDSLEGLGFQLIHSAPKDGADEKKIAFLHPSTTNRVLVELCQ